MVESTIRFRTTSHVSSVVFAHAPDLVIWRSGTNDVAWGGRPDQRLKSSVLEGVRSLKAGSTDVVLMDLQYAPRVLASASYSTMEGIIADVAKQERVGLFSRFALMRNSINAGVAQSELVSWDGLHNTADGLHWSPCPSHLNEPLRPLQRG